MYKKIISVAIFFFSAEVFSQEPNNLGSLFYKEVTADIETEPVFVADDAADDMCVLENKTEPDKSLIISSDKKYGIIVYNLDGKKLFDYPVGRINNVDIIQSKGRFYVAGTNRTKNNIEIYEFGIDGQLQSTLISENVQSLKDVYGITFYNGKQEKYLFVSDKKGNVEQWRIELDRSDPKIYLTRKLRFSSLVEGIVSDEKNNVVFIGQEKKGIWKIDPINPYVEKELIYKKNKFMRPDFEGLALREDENNNGYIVASVQGSNGYLLLDRLDYTPKLFFRVVDSPEIDGTTETDGIEVSNIKTKKFPNGFFIAQDDDNDGLNQNFKIVDWNKIKLNE